jgi:transposase InsO family protein
MRSLSYQDPPHTLSQAGRARLYWIEWHKAHGENKSLTCRRFGISRPTFTKWLNRYDCRHLKTLESHPKRPYRVRRPEWSTDAVLAVLELRKRFPRWGKKKLTVLLKRAGWALSQSTVGRILTHLRRSGQLHFHCRQVQMRWRKTNRPWAVRKPKDFGAQLPGDIVQIDTVDLRPLPGVILKQLSATDVVSRWSGVGVASRATARTTRDSFKKILDRFPFPVRGVQIDGGSEFMAEFEAFCAAERLDLFLLPPHSPKLNGRVERFNRTSREEFHECATADATVAALQPAALEWEQIYNTVRPHEALGLKTPAEFLNSLGLYPEVAAWQL